MLVPVDWFFLGMALLIIALAGLRGFIAELTGIVCFAGGVYFALIFFRQGAVFIRAKTLSNMSYLPEALAFVILFFIMFSIIKIVGALLGEFVERTGIAVIDKALGILLGIVKAMVILALVIFLIKAQPLFDGEALLKNSLVARYLSPSRTFIEQALEPRHV